MLSVNGETKTVMQEITHGACNYLLKPVRIEELRNIWQHVVWSVELHIKFIYAVNHLGIDSKNLPSFSVATFFWSNFFSHYSFMFMQKVCRKGYLTSWMLKNSLGKMLQVVYRYFYRWRMYSQNKMSGLWCSTLLSIAVGYVFCTARLPSNVAMADEEI